MKNLLAVLAILISTVVKAQLDLPEKDFNNLVLIGEYYSKNPMLSLGSAIGDLEKLRTEKLNQIIDVLQISARKDTGIISKKYLTRPVFDDLMMWYVIREIHYNLTNKKEQPIPSAEVARKVLSEKIDERALVDNYYHRIQAPVAMLFNNQDFSKINIDLNDYNLTNNFEKASLYFNLLDAFTTRFKVLQYMKNHKKLMEFAARMPTFNGKQYFYYTDFEYEDFQWIGHEVPESYNKRHIGNLYSTLSAHLNAVAEAEQQEMAKEIYINSILSEPRYFHFSSGEAELKKLHEQRIKK